MPMRLRWPPENWCGKRRMSDASMPTRCRMSADVVVAASRRDQAVHHGRLADDVDDAHARVERGVRVLEDHLHGEALGAPRGAVVAPRSGRPFQKRSPGGGLEDARDDAPERRLAAARLAHQAHDLALADREVHVRRAHAPSCSATFAPSARAMRPARSRRFTKRLETPRSSSSGAAAALMQTGLHAAQRAARRGSAPAGAARAGVAARARSARGRRRPRPARAARASCPGSARAAGPGALRLGTESRRPRV